MMKKIVCISLIIFSILLVGCNHESQYSKLLAKYIKICEQYSNKPLPKNTIEEIIELKTSSYNKGKGEDFNSYIFTSDDEELTILTDNKTDKLAFINYNKVNEVDLSYSTKKDTSIGDSKYGFTSKFNLDTLDKQKYLLNKYLNKK